MDGITDQAPLAKRARKHRSLAETADEENVLAVIDKEFDATTKKKKVSTRENAAPP
jgi:hypothetical protein